MKKTKVVFQIKRGDRILRTFSIYEPVEVDGFSYSADSVAVGILSQFTPPAQLWRGNVEVSTIETC